MSTSKGHGRAGGGNGMKDEELLPLVAGTIAGDRRARDDLWLALDPRIERIAGRRRLTSRLCGSWDDRRNIVVLVMDRLLANDCERLRRLHQVVVRGEGAGWPWIVALVRNTALNYTKAHQEHLGAGAREDGSRWATILPFDGEVAERLPAPGRLISAMEARRIQAYAEQALPPPQVRALCLWLTGHDDGEIARALDLADARAATRLVHAAILRLRHRFARRGGAENKSSEPRDETAPDAV